MINTNMSVSNVYKTFGINTDNRKNAVSNNTNAVKQGRDGVKLSDEALSFQTALKAARSTSEVRTDRVDEVKQAIANGTYKVDTSAIANKILGL